MSCSLLHLHASPNFRQVYSKVGGYQSARSEWYVVPNKLKHFSTAKISSDDDSDNNGWCIHHANFPEDAFQLQRLHTDYSEKQLVTIV